MKNFDISRTRSKMTFPEGELESLSVYLNLAEATIKKYGGRYRDFLLKSEDCLSYLAHCIILADLKWDASKAMSKKSWRISQAIYGISKYLKKIGRNNKSGSNLDVTISHERTPLNELIEIEDSETALHSLYNSGLQNREACVVKMRLWDNMTFVQIGKEYKISKQMAGNIYKTALKKLGEKWNPTTPKNTSMMTDAATNVTMTTT